MGWLWAWGLEAGSSSLYLDGAWLALLPTSEISSGGGRNVQIGEQLVVKVLWLSHDGGCRALVGGVMLMGEQKPV